MSAIRQPDGARRDANGYLVDSGVLTARMDSFLPTGTLWICGQRHAYVVRDAMTAILFTPGPFTRIWWRWLLRDVRNEFRSAWQDATR